MTEPAGEREPEAQASDGAPAPFGPPLPLQPSWPERAFQRIQGYFLDFDPTFLSALAPLVLRELETSRSEEGGRTVETRRFAAYAFELEDVEVRDYVAAPTIKAPIAV